ncbi:hypothetical protein GQF61_09550 [Sphingobacterium sp. DK4209]|uniref:Lipocalin-like domain-containing protein n=1 Tax=Sphingobacterium zhuxiongii TaxID=2662364 RepID=A0A5Q0QG10_9SPHI|nr:MULTISPECIES: hypothetical protein [unclassified Sphingobacterium]MVZ66101.1 hypothetical protein [Sphingobacterium sp. DK4209]QGA26522.1 hypothetical protein GFH32_09380 [Sphingobacterium sp. dk4302]
MKRFFFLPLLITIISCGTSANGPKKPKIEGNWRWIKSTGGYAGRTTTPESTNKELHLQITKDSIFSYENGELQSARPYHLQLGKAIESQKMEWLIESGVHKTSIYRRDSVLIMNQQCYDCFSQTYVKMKE